MDYRSSFTSSGKIYKEIYKSVDGVESFEKLSLISATDSYNYAM